MKEKREYFFDKKEPVEETIKKLAFPEGVIVNKGNKYFFEGKEIGLDKMAQMLNSGVKIVKEA